MSGPRITVAVLLLAALAGTWYWLSSRELPPPAAPVAVPTSPTAPPVEETAVLLARG